MLTRLTHRIIIQSLSIIPAGGGTFEETWTTIGERWANVQVQNANEQFRFGKDQQINRYRIIMRKENFTNKNRFIFNGLILNIETVDDPTQDNRMMVIYARGELT